MCLFMSVGNCMQVMKEEWTGAPMASSKKQTCSALLDSWVVQLMVSVLFLSALKECNK